MKKTSSEIPIGKRIQTNRKFSGLTQEQLAQMAKVPYTTLTKIESGAIKNPSLQAVSRIANALQVPLDDFIMVQTYRGEDVVARVWEDSLRVMKPGDTMLISGVDENDYVAANEEGIYNFIADLSRNNLKQKLLSCEGDYFGFEGEHLEYRWVPKDYFISTPLYVYSGTVAAVIWEEPQQAVITRNPVLAEAYHKQFMYMWENAKIIPGKRKRPKPRKKTE